MYICICVWMYAMCMCWPRPEEDIRFPEAGIMGGCELPDMDAGNHMQVLWKSMFHGRAVCTPNCWPISPSPCISNFKWPQQNTGSFWHFMSRPQWVGSFIYIFWLWLWTNSEMQWLPIHLRKYAIFMSLIAGPKWLIFLDYCMLSTLACLKLKMWEKTRM